MDKILVYFAEKYNGDWNGIFQAINTKEKVDIEQVEKVFTEKQEQYNIITMISEDYPEFLKHIYMPPFVLFYKKTKPTKASMSKLPVGQGRYILD